MGHEFVNAVEVGYDSPDFLFGEDGRDAFTFLGAEGKEGGFVEGNLEDVAVEEEDGAEGLVLGGFGYFSFNDEVGDELVDFADGHLAGVDGDLTAVEVGVVIANVLADPVEVGFFGARGVLFEADVFAVLVEKFFRSHR